MFQCRLLPNEILHRIFRYLSLEDLISVHDAHPMFARVIMMQKQWNARSYVVHSVKHIKHPVVQRNSEFRLYLSPRARKTCIADLPNFRSLHLESCIQNTNRVTNLPVSLTSLSICYIKHFQCDYLIHLKDLCIQQSLFSMHDVYIDDIPLSVEKLTVFYCWLKWFKDKKTSWNLHTVELFACGFRCISDFPNCDIWFFHANLAQNHLMIYGFPINAMVYSVEGYDHDAHNWFTDRAMLWFDAYYSQPTVKSDRERFYHQPHIQKDAVINRFNQMATQCNHSTVRINV